MSESLEWTEGGPRSVRFDDIFFSPDDGLAETRHVFLDGCGLPGAWAGRDRFVIGELGFGTGLNCLAAAELWSRRRPTPDAVLHLFSVEAFPIAMDDAARALGAFSELSALTGPLLGGWPRGRAGFHRIEWPDLRIVLDLAVLEAAAGLAAWSGRADAWFLDGFAPAKNPLMWREEVLQLVGARSRPGARVATFTAAGAVRRGLNAAGFQMDRRTGYGRKTESLHGVRAGAATAASPRRALVIGAGVAGAALKRAFHRIGAGADLLDAVGPGAGASGNRAALVGPRLDAGGGAEAAMFAAAFHRASALYRAETPDAVIAVGALELARTRRDAARFARILELGLFDRGALERRAPKEVAALLEEAVAPEALFVRDALVVDPRAVLERWAGETLTAAVASLRREGEVWVALDDDGREVARAAIVCLAGGAMGRTLAPVLDLRPLHGHVTTAEGVRCPGGASSFGGYVIPTRTGLLFGATHDRGREDLATRSEDDDRNLAVLAEQRPGLAARVAGAKLAGRAGVRATTRDHLPHAGAVDGDRGLFVLTGLGGRGFTTAPLLAEAVAALALDAPGPVDADVFRRLDPLRRRRTP